MKKFFGFVLMLLCPGCERSRANTAYHAWVDEAACHGWPDQELKSLRTGKVVRYACGCEWTVERMGGVFGPLPIPPPHRCRKHNREIVGAKYPEEWMAELEGNPAP